MHMRVMINVYFRMFGKIKAFLTSWYCFIKKKNLQLFWEKEYFDLRNIHPKKVKGLSLRTI